MNNTTINNFEKQYISMVNTFNLYHNRVQEYILEATKDYNYFFKDNNCFFRIIFHVLKHFLEEDDSKILFIKLPVQELGKKPSEIENNRNCFQKVFFDVMNIATKEKLKENIVTQELKKCNEGDVYYCENTNHVTQKITGPIFLKMKHSQNDGQLYPSLILSGNKRFSTSEARKTYQNNKALKMKKCPCATGNNNVHSATKKHIEEIYNLFQNYLSSKDFNKKYESAQIIGFNEGNTSLFENEYFYSPVEFKVKVNENEPFSTDILCFLGNRKYQGVWDNVLRAIGQGKLKKAVFVGTSLDEFKPSNENKLFEFSIRELYRYLSSTKFPTVYLSVLPFEWLENKIVSLNETISHINLEDSKKKFLIGRCLRHLMGEKIADVDEEDERDLFYFLHDNFQLSEEEENLIIEWYIEELKYTGKTPKESFIEELNTNDTIPINPFSYKRKIKNLSKSPKGNNTFIIDVQGDMDFYVDILKTITSFLISGTIHLISYVQTKKIQEYIFSEQNIYNNEYRKRLLGANTFQWNLENEKDTESNLFSYFSPSLLDEYIKESLSENTQSTKYEVAFEGGIVENLSGNVLINKKEIPISEIEDSFNDYERPKITYYSSPKNFDLFIQIIHDFPKGNDVSFYTRLWKEKLLDYCNTEYNKDYKKMRKEQFPFLKEYMMRQYIKPDADINFPRKFYRVVRVMKVLNLFDTETEKYLLSAYRADKERAKHGRYLKSALFDYYIKDIKNDYLKEFDRKAQARGEQITSDDLFNECIKTNKIVSIKKIR